MHWPKPANKVFNFSLKYYFESNFGDEFKLKPYACFWDFGHNTFRNCTLWFHVFRGSFVFVNLDFVSFRRWLSFFQPDHCGFCNRCPDHEDKLLVVAYLGSVISTFETSVFWTTQLFWSISLVRDYQECALDFSNTRHLEPISVSFFEVRIIEDKVLRTF